MEADTPSYAAFVSFLYLYTHIPGQPSYLIVPDTRRSAYATRFRSNRR